MKNNNTILLIIILILAVVHLLQSKERIVIDNTGKINQIEKEVDSLIKLNSQLEKKISTIDKNISTLDSSIILVNKNILKIKSSTKNKIDSVDKFQYSDLEKFFNERYRVK